MQQGGINSSFPKLCGQETTNVRAECGTWKQFCALVGKRGVGFNPCPLHAAHSLIDFNSDFNSD